MNIDELKALLDQVTPGEWSAWCDDCMEWNIHNDENVIVVRDSDARIIALAPTLARRVIAAEKMADALRQVADTDPDDSPHWFHDIANAALAEWDVAQ